MTKCGNCGRSVKGFFSATLLAQSKIDFINKYSTLNKESYCNICADPVLTKIGTELESKKIEIDKRLQEIIDVILVISSNAPVKWDYEVIGMVTSQNTSGTGFLTDLSQSFNDFFGTSSKRSSKKLAVATSLCMNDLRVQCLRNGGNAVVGTNITLTEIGSGSTNMIMVGIAGTAIRVTNMENFTEKTRDLIAEAVEWAGQLEAINQDKK